MKNTNAFLTAVYALLLISTTGCFRKFYKTNSISYPDSLAISKAASPGKKVYIHFKDSVFQLKQISVNAPMISGYISSVPQDMKYLRSLPGKPNLMKKKDMPSVLSQVHMYLNENVPDTTKSFTCSTTQVVRFDVYDMDVKATNQSKKISKLGLILGGIFITLYSILLGLFAIAFG